MSNDSRDDAAGIEEIRRGVRDLTGEERKRMKRVLKAARKLRERTNIAPLTTADLVRMVRDEQDEAH